MITDDKYDSKPFKKFKWCTIIYTVRYNKMLWNDYFHFTRNIEDLYPLRFAIVQREWHMSIFIFNQTEGHMSIF
jgi:hypothetical protein